MRIAVNILGILNAIWIMVALPIYPVAKLRLALSQKIAVIGIFLLGGIACIASFYRLITVPMLDQLNLAFTVKGAAVFGQVETAVAIIAACLLMLRLLPTKLLYSIGIINTTNSEDTGTKRSGRSRSSTLSSYTLRKPRNAGVEVIMEEDGPKLDNKAPSQQISAPEDAVIKEGNADAVPIEVIHVRRNVDIEAGRADGEPLASLYARKEWSRAGSNRSRAGSNHVADQYRYP